MIYDSPSPILFPPLLLCLLLVFLIYHLRLKLGRLVSGSQGHSTPGAAPGLESRLISQLRADISINLYAGRAR